MELLLHQWGDWPELYRNTDKTEATEIVIIYSQMNYRGKLDTYGERFLSLTGPWAPRVVVSPSWAMSIKSALRASPFFHIAKKPSGLQTA